LEEYAMRALLGIAILGLTATLTMGQGGDKDKKEVTLKGKICCAKCELSVEPECMTVIVVKDKDKKDVTLYFDAAGNKKHHGAICSEAKTGTVTGTVTEDAKTKKKTVTVKSLKFD